MSDLATDFLLLIDKIAQQRPLPPIQSFELAPPLSATGDRKNNFAALLLQDGSVGLTYTALDNTLHDLQTELPALALPGTSVAELARLYTSTSVWQRALGLAAINAICQHCLKDCDTLVTMPDTLPALAAEKTDRIGMVGYFSRIVDPLTTLGIPLTVIELDEQYLRKDSTVEVTLDANRLSNCNKVIITGTTLLNHSLDRMLQYCSNADEIFLLGPSASCLPEPLFDRGVTLIGGFHVTDAENFLINWKAGTRWRDYGVRYGLSTAGYQPESAT